MGAFAAEEEKAILPRGRPVADRPAEECSPNPCCVILAVATVFGLIWWMFQAIALPQYSVEIAAVSGIDPGTDLHARRGSLDLAFNLTVGIASGSSVYSACIKPGTAVKVSYSDLHLPLANGRVPDVCVGPWRPMVQQNIVARGIGVIVPGYLLDSLAEDIKRGEAVFELEMTAPSSARNTDFSRLAECKGTVGAKASCSVYN